MANVDIKALSQELASQAASWSARESHITAMVVDELQFLVGYNPPPESGELSLEAREAQSLAMARGDTSAAAVGAPAAFDLRNVGGSSYITAVRNQQSCGSCVSFGAIATVEGTMRYARRDPALAIDLSEGHLFNCIARSQGRNCGNGWWVAPALQALRDGGVVDEACSPYSPADQQCTLCTGWADRVVRITSFTELRAAAEMKDWISKRGPLVACFTVYSDFTAYASGIYRRTPSSTSLGGHCVSVVGYDDVAGAWICKNSWSAAWGDQGYFRIAYGECGIDASMWGVEAGAAPTPTGRFVPLHRYWNPGIGDHFYTTSWSELGGGRYGWGYEGVQCYVAATQATGLVPLYRYWNPGIGDHFYTTSWSELGGGRYGWSYEGVQCYVAPRQLPGTLPLYRYWNPGIGDHFYTTSWSELGGGRYGWSYEGVQCYVWRSAAGVGESIPQTFATAAGPGAMIGDGPAWPAESEPAPQPLDREAPVAQIGSPASFQTDAGRATDGLPASFRHTEATAAPGASFTTPADPGCGCGKQRG